MTKTQDSLNKPFSGCWECISGSTWFRAMDNLSLKPYTALTTLTTRSGETLLPERIIKGSREILRVFCDLEIGRRYLRKLHTKGTRLLLVLQYTWALSWRSRKWLNCQMNTCKRKSSRPGVMSGWAKRMKSKNPQKDEIDYTPASEATETDHPRKIQAFMLMRCYYREWNN